MGRLDEKVAIVTGSGRGIGRATAKLFGAEGAKVVVLSRTPENVERVVADIQADGGEALGVVCDIADPHQITASVKKVIEEYGRIDILVNNAFDPSAVLSSVIDLSTEQLQRNFEMGPIAYLRMMQACYPHLKASGEGRIINFGSTAGVVAIEGYAPYGMAPRTRVPLCRRSAEDRCLVFLSFLPPYLPTGRHTLESSQLAGRSGGRLSRAARCLGGRRARRGPARGTVGDERREPERCRGQ
ncbi:SDR family NAD(P)-dependent oxidoreductase [Streptomyces sp. LN500]|uniref:SDR family NAD(P)-dependent oxidoreductase n=1 Tax=Streptomyces sp. LN500 TaxID=3112978 RepID=UPI00371114C0